MGKHRFEEAQGEEVEQMEFKLKKREDIEDLLDYLVYEAGADTELLAYRFAKRLTVEELRNEVVSVARDMFKEDMLEIDFPKKLTLLEEKDASVMAKRIKRASNWELARQGFAALEKEDYPYLRYRVMVDGYFDHWIDAYSDDEAIIEFLVEYPMAIIYDTPKNIDNKWASREIR